MTSGAIDRPMPAARNEVFPLLEKYFTNDAATHVTDAYLAAYADPDHMCRTAEVAAIRPGDAYLIDLPLVGKGRDATSA